jgi:hypothetical protein
VRLAIEIDQREVRRRLTGAGRSETDRGSEADREENTKERFHERDGEKGQKTLSTGPPKPKGYSVWMVQPLDRKRLFPTASPLRPLPGCSLTLPTLPTMLFKLTRQERRILSWLAMLIALGVLGVWVL